MNRYTLRGDIGGNVHKSGSVPTTQLNRWCQIWREEEILPVPLKFCDGIVNVGSMCVASNVTYLVSTL